jgi:hypothetical protein
MFSKKSSKAGPKTDAGRQLNEELSGCRYASMFGRLFTKILLPDGRCRIINRIVVTILLFVIELRKLPKCEFVMDIKEFMFCLEEKAGGIIIKGCTEFTKKKDGRCAIKLA